MSRVCLDSNVWVAAFAARGLCEEVVRRSSARDELILPDVVADEVRRVLRTKLRLAPDALAWADAVMVSCIWAPRTQTTSPVPVGDPDDERILADAIDAGVEVFVTGDKEILACASEAPISILSPRDFIEWSRLRGGG